MRIGKIINKYINRCSLSLAIIEMQMKTKMGYYSTSTRTDKMKRKETKGGRETAEN